jgi:hypothetical protein
MIKFYNEIKGKKDFYANVHNCIIDKSLKLGEESPTTGE